MIRKATLEVRNIGLHARPAAVVVMCLKDLDCTVTFRKDDEVVDGKSILGMLTLACERGARVEVTCEGQDAELAINALRELRDDDLMFAEVK